MQVTFILPDGLGLGGVTTWSIDMAQQLAAAGQPASLLEHINPHLPIGIPEQYPNVRLIQHNGRLPTYVRPRNISHYLPAYRSALPGTFIPNYSFGTYAACAAIAEQQPEQIRILGFAHTDQYYYYHILKYYEPIIHQFVAVSQEVAQNLATWIPHRRADIVVRPYGVHVESELQRSYSPSSAPIQLIYAGRLVEYQKRVSDLIALAEILGQRQVNFLLRIVGEGPERDYLGHMVRALSPSVQERIRFEGHVPYAQMPDMWRTADMCVLTSECEGTSIAMLEAMANGCVPIVTRVSGTGAAITPGHNGYLVSVGDIEGMAQIIQRLAVERESLPGLGDAAHRRIIEEFSFSAYVTWFQTLVREVEKQPPRPWPAGRPLLPRLTMFYLGWIAMSPWLWRGRRWYTRFSRWWKRRKRHN